MPLYHVSGWNSTRARQDSLYLEADSADAARTYAFNVGVSDPRVDPCDEVPAGERPISLTGPRRAPPRPPHPLDGLVWRVALGVLLGNLGAALVLVLLRS